MARSSISVASPDGRYYVEAAGRAIELLEYLSSEPTPLSLGELVEGLGWSKPMLYRLVRTLEAHGALRHSAGKGYYLGPMLLTLGRAAADTMQVWPIAKPHMEELHRKLGGAEAVNLGVLDGDEVVYVGRLEGRDLVGMRATLNSRLPAYATSMGQILLAWLSPEELAHRLANTDFAQLAPNTLTGQDQLEGRLEQVRSLGFAITDEEFTVGVRAAAAPIRDYTGEVVAALNVTLPVVRASVRDILLDVVPHVQRAATAISAELGGEDAATER